MRNLRPTLGNTRDMAVPDDDALYMIRDSVARRHTLIWGRLEDREGHVCAIGAFFADNGGKALNSALVDEVAAYNDSVPPSVPDRERRNKVLEWLNWKLDVLAGRVLASVKLAS